MTSQHSLRPLLGALLTSALVAFPVFASAQELAPAHVDPATELRFPKKLSQLRFERVVEFPTKQLGYCVVYSATTALGQVCVYDLGHQNLPTGVESKEFNAALNIAVDGMLKVASTPPYRNGTLISSATPSIEADGKAAKAEMRIFTSELTRPDKSGVHNVHLILMTSGLGKFIKLNYTAQDTDSEAFAAESRQIVEEFIRFNGSTLEKLLVKADG